MAKIATLSIRIDGADERTLQEQIYAGIRRSIVEGLIGAERRLPSTRALAAELGVSRTTVLLAVETLHAEGYLESKRGAGTFVTRELPDTRPRPAPAVRAPRAEAHPLLSARGRALAETPTPDRRFGGPPRAFRLGTPALDLFPVRLWSQIAQQCMRSAPASRLDYSPLAGLLPLREAIAEQVRARGTQCDAEQVIVVAGAQRGLDLTAHLLLDPGDPVWMEDPGYPGARSAFVSAGARVLSVPVDADGMDVDRLAGRNDVRLAYVTPSHQFPLGVPMSLKKRRAVLAWARRSRAWVIEDDYDCDFRYHARPLLCLHALDPDGRVIYLGSFSKTLFPALRLGFLIVPNDLVDGFARARVASDLHPPSFEQAIVAEFMIRGHYQRHLRRMQAAYAERLDALQQAIEASGVPLRLRPVHSGLHAVADLEGADAERVAHEAAARKIEVMPLSYYYVGGGEGSGYGYRDDDADVANGSDLAPPGLGERPNALVLGFGSVPPNVIRTKMAHLAAAIDAARGKGPLRDGRTI